MIQYVLLDIPDDLPNGKYSMMVDRERTGVKDGKIVIALRYGGPWDYSSRTRNGLFALMVDVISTYIVNKVDLGHPKGE